MGGTAARSVWLRERMPLGAPPVTVQTLRRCVCSDWKPLGEFLLRGVSSVASLSSRTLLCMWMLLDPQLGSRTAFLLLLPLLLSLSASSPHADSQTGLGRTVERGCDQAPGVAAGHVLLAPEPPPCPCPSAGAPQRFLCSSKKVIFHGEHSNSSTRPGQGRHSVVGSA